MCAIFNMMTLKCAFDYYNSITTAQIDKHQGLNKSTIAFCFILILINLMKRMNKKINKP